MTRTINGAAICIFQIDLDPTHSVIRVTVNEEIVSQECAEDVYQHLSRIVSKDGPYAVIYDLSISRDTSMSAELVRSLARRPPAIPMGRPHVVVGKFPAIYGLARLFQMCAEFRGKEYEVVHTLNEAYDIVGVQAEDFTKRLFLQRMAAWSQPDREA